MKQYVSLKTSILMWCEEKNRGPSKSCIVSVFGNNTVNFFLIFYATDIKKTLESFSDPSVIIAKLASPRGFEPLLTA